MKKSIIPVYFITFALWIFSYLSLPHLLIYADQDYEFVDLVTGNKIRLPDQLPIFSIQNPGPWKELESSIDPLLKTRVRKDGLESIRVLYIRIPYNPPEATTNHIQALYVLDKDDLIIGYKAFPISAEEYYAEIWINGIINYIQLYIETSENGLWKKEYDFPFQ